MTDDSADDAQDSPRGHLPWPDSDTPAPQEQRSRGQAVVSGVPALGAVAFGRAPRPFDLPDNPEPAEP